MADNSQRIKNYFLTISGVMLAFIGTKTIDNPYFLIGFICVSFAFWYMDSRYLQLERLFRKHHNAILDGSIGYLEQFRFNPMKYKKDSVIQLMFFNFTMIMYPLIMLLMCVIVLIPYLLALLQASSIQ